MKRWAGPDATRHTPHAGTLLATSPAGHGARRFALAAVVASLVFFAFVVPWAKEPWPQVWAFIPLYAAALVVSDLITVVLLVGQFRIGRKPALLMLAAGYLFTALATVAHGLSFPGLFAAGGLLGGGPQTTAWLYMFWHGGFPLFVIGYVLLSRKSARPAGIAVPTGAAIAGVAFVTAIVVGGLTLLATAGHDLLPAIMQGNRYTTAMKGVVSGVWLASLVALGLLWWRRPHSVLDVWLMVVLCAWLLDVALSAVLNGGRFDAGFYVGRAYGLVAATFVLGVLLLENGRLYAGLIESHAQERARAAELRELSDRLEVVNGRLSESNDQLKEQTRLKSEFLANMSHELRTPLNAVIGFSDMLKEGHADDPEKQRRFAGHIYQSGHHLLALVNDILDLSKIEAGKGELALGVVHVESAMAEALAMLSGQAQARQVRLRLDARGSLGEMRADARRLKQILLNLLSNALKFSPVAGTVTLRVETVDRRRAESALPGYRDGVRKALPKSDFDRFVEISVSDGGVGMARADLDRLFTPFVQVPSASSRGGEGTGLGLVMVHRLADLHGGAVSVTSAPGKGSCFTVWLPLRGEGTSDTSAARRASATRVALVVEDNSESAALVQAQLEEKGFRVRCVASAEAALGLVEEFTPDLITLDILLPDMDGWELLAELKSTAWESVPVVVISVVADQGRGFSLGAALVLQKPIMRDALARGLERLGMVPEGERDVTVLVIDDDAAAVELLAEQLRQCDCVVLRALGGREGIDLARRFRPDLITLDLEMPEVSGFDVVEALKGSASTAQIPIVVVTARDLSPFDREQLNGHVLDIVGKAEFNHGRFVGEVERAMSKVS